MTEPREPAVTKADVEAAAARIAGHVRRTPVLRVILGGRDVWLKLEQLQITGSFKARGATNALHAMSPRPPAVVAASGGNHGMGVAFAAATIGASATIVVPTTIPPEKARRIAALDATVVRHGDAYAATEQRARTLAEELGVAFLHPFADPAVIAGQGTIALEVLADTDADIVVAAVGGGGLLSGIGVGLSGSGVRAVGVEPTGIRTMYAALQRGTPVDVGVASVTASALGAGRTTQRNLDLVAAHTEGVVLVTDAATLAARDLLWDACRIAVEPAGAIGLAAVLDGQVGGDRPCVVLCGANSAWVPAS